MCYGYIYHITNKINNKKYIGQTTNIEHRLEEHLSALRKNNHHSHKLQRAFNLYGENNFIFSWEKRAYQKEEELQLDEMKEIEKYDSYNNGYNETQGGDGHRTIFNFSEQVLLYNILQRYDGIIRYLSSFYHCDASVFTNIRDNHQLFSEIKISNDELNNLITRLKLKEENLKEQYKPHNQKKLNKNDCFEILSIISFEEGYDKILGEIFSFTSKLTYRLRRGLIYKDWIEEFNLLSEDEKKEIQKNTKKKYNLNKIKAERNRRSTKNQLTQEQVNYIIDNENKQTQTLIAKHLGISIDRVRGIIKRETYKDLIEEYYSSKNTLA